MPDYRARLLLGEQWTSDKLKSLIISLSGVVFLSGVVGKASWDLTGTLVGLLAPISIAFATILAKRSTGHFSSLTLAVYGTGFSAVVLFPITMVFFGGLQALSLPGGLTPVWILGMGLMLGLLAIMLLTWGLHWLDAGTSSLLCLMEPVMASLFAWILFGQWLTPWQWVGAALIMLSAVMLQGSRFGRRRGVAPKST